MTGTGKVRGGHMMPSTWKILPSPVVQIQSMDTLYTNLYPVNLTQCSHQDPMFIKSGPRVSLDNAHHFPGATVRAGSTQEKQSFDYSFSWPVAS